MAADGVNERVCGKRVSTMLSNGDSTSVLLAMAYQGVGGLVMFVEKKDRLLTWTACRVAECSNSIGFFQGTLG